MTASKYLIALCLIGAALAQVNETETEVGAGTETVTDAPPRGRSCFVGEGESYDSIEGEMKACKFLENSCQSKVEITADGIRVYGECKELAACESNQESSVTCFSQRFTKAQSEDMEHVCHYCCQGDLCNTAAFTGASVDSSRDALLFK